jgi:Peptidase family S41/Tricorn protease C1 domain
MCRRIAFVLAALVAMLLTALPARVWGQKGLSREDQQTDLLMLKDAKETLQKYYYDPKLHGLDVDALYAKDQEKVQNSQSNHEAFSWIASFVDSLNDSHTRFIPPVRAATVDYGYALQMIGDKCYVTHLRPGSDAAAKLHVGDEVISRENVAVTRNNFPYMLYYFNLLAPVTLSNFSVIDPQGTPRPVQVDSKVAMGGKIVEFTPATFFKLITRMQQEYDDNADQYIEPTDNDSVFIWKMHEFMDDSFDVEAMFGRIRKRKALILDLRGNPGGSVDTLEDVLGFLFDHPISVADRAGRKKLKPITIKSHGSYAFAGKLIVLVDSDSASGAEILARVVQLENRGTVIGDRSSGQVMEAEFQSGNLAGSDIDYGFEVTVSDLIMKDGKSIEHIGVTPDEVVLPAAADLAQGRDPAMARALAIAGLPISPEQAGKLFPYKWLPL